MALRVLALDALGERVDDGLLSRLREHRPGTLVNETIWTVIALRAVGEEPPATFVQAILAAQAKSGAFSWSVAVCPTRTTRRRLSEALRAAGAWRAAIDPRASSHCASFRDKRRRLRADERSRVRRPVDRVGDPGADQRGAAAGKAPFRYLSRVRRADGSYHYSARYATTPVWVTAQVLPALTGKPFPAALTM